MHEKRWSTIAACKMQGLRVFRLPTWYRLLLFVVLLLIPCIDFSLSYDIYFVYIPAHGCFAAVGKLYVACNRNMIDL